MLKIDFLNKSEIFILTSLAIPTLFFGFYPEPLLRTVDVSINNLVENYQTNLNLYIAQKGN